MTTLKANPALGNMGGWQERHNDAVSLAAANFTPKPFESAIVKMLAAWSRYAKDHKARFDSPIGDDGVLGDYWKDAGLAIRGLLNGEMGQLDCGTLDAYILDTLKDNAIDTEQL